MTVYFFCTFCFFYYNMACSGWKLLQKFCRDILDMFVMQDWSSTDTLMTNNRVAALQTLQPLIELQEFLTFMSEESNFQTRIPAERLVAMWGKRTPHYLTDPITVWDDVVTNRYFSRIYQQILFPLVCYFTLEKNLIISLSHDSNAYSLKKVLKGHQKSVF